jgi:Glycosyl-transferase for dystroglycan
MKINGTGIKRPKTKMINDTAHTTMNESSLHEDVHHSCHSSRFILSIFLVVILQPVLYSSISRSFNDKFSPQHGNIKNFSASSQTKLGFDHMVVLPKNTTGSPYSTISLAIKKVFKDNGIKVVSGMNSGVQVMSAMETKLRQVIPNAIPRKESFRRDDIVLLTHLSISRLPQLMIQAQWWHGPISAAIVITSEKDMDTLFTFIDSNQETFSMTSFHVLVERPMGESSYPYNVLRNLAMREAEADYILAVDVDFVVGDYDNLRALVRENEQVQKHLHSRRLLVLPAFENTAKGLREEAVPKSKADIINMVAEDEVSPFEITFWTKGHGATNFDMYYANSTDILYEITYRYDFEPYVLAYRHGLPRYWNDFRSYYYNKCSFFLEAHLMGFKFSVLRDFFVFHIGKSGNPPSVKGIPLVEQEKNWKFQEYLSVSYGIPLFNKIVQLLPLDEILA